mmetsp:Transcript_80414/g.236568  ORF Transcript_80414/g.236568 Transcript_80414/m.236568 type:complete len:424 (-) Transcript_80414:508-1779(-)
MQGCVVLLHVLLMDVCPQPQHERYQRVMPPAARQEERGIGRPLVLGPGAGLAVQQQTCRLHMPVACCADERGAHQALHLRLRPRLEKQLDTGHMAAGARGAEDSQPPAPHVEGAVRVGPGLQQHAQRLAEPEGHQHEQGGHVHGDLVIQQRLDGGPVAVDGSQAHGRPRLVQLRRGRQCLRPRAQELPAGRVVASESGVGQGAELAVIDGLQLCSGVEQEPHHALLPVEAGGQVEGRLAERRPRGQLRRGEVRARLIAAPRLGQPVHLSSTAKGNEELGLELDALQGHRQRHLGRPQLLASPLLEGAHQEVLHVDGELVDADGGVHLGDDALPVLLPGGLRVPRVDLRNLARQIEQVFPLLTHGFIIAVRQDSVLRGDVEALLQRVAPKHLVEAPDPLQRRGLGVQDHDHRVTGGTAQSEFEG